MTLLHHRLGTGERVSVEYGLKDTNRSPEEITIALEGSRAMDTARGSTTVGPHRDDLTITVLGRDARLFGSQGQQRTAVISLKLASLEVAHEELMVSPLLLLDDIFSDLDASRRELLVEVVLDNAGQVVLTCTESASAGPKVLERARLFTVCSGRITPH
jgi:DNA replication and repair protein RecF